MGAETVGLELVGSQRADIIAVGDSPPTPPIRRAAAITGSGLALLAGVAGLISQVIFFPAYGPWAQWLGLAAYLVPTVIAVIALLRVDRLAVAGLLQGAWWIAVAFVTADVVTFSVDHMFGATGRFLAGFYVSDVSDVLGAAAAILLMFSWSPAVGWRRAPRLRPLQVVLLCGVGLSQIATLIYIFNWPGRSAASETLGIAELLVGLAVTWYAVNLPASALGGALVLGWTIASALLLLEISTPWTGISDLGCVLLAAVMFLALIYIIEGTQETQPETP